MNNIEMEINTKLTSNQFTYIATFQDADLFLSDLIRGGVQSYATSDFLQNDSDYISNAIYYPVVIEQFFDNKIASTIRIGKVTTAYSGELVSENHAVKVLTNGKASRIHNNFLDFEPYTKHTLAFPFFEPLNIPCFNMYKGIDIYLAIDFTNGHATLYVCDNTSGKIIVTSETTIGIQLPIGAGNGQEQQRNKILQAISLVGAGAGALVGAVSGNPVTMGGAIALGTNVLKQALQNNVDTYSGKGSSGNRDSVFQNLEIGLYTETVKGVTIPNAHEVGRPLNATRLLNNLTGFTQVGNIHFNPLGYDIFNDEINEIVTLLQTGVIL